MITRGRLAKFAGFVLAAGVIAGCANGADSTTPPTPEPDVTSPEASEQIELGTVVVGSQGYYSNEIVAEIYAQVLEEAGFEVVRQFQIGQRDAYIPALEAGEVDLFPEYTGNLLQFYSPDTSATQADEVYAELVTALPDQLIALAMSPATDQDSYNVTAETAAEFNLVSIADLANLDGPITLGGAPELAERPYGPSGLSSVYGVEVQLDATGPATLEALLEGVVLVANIYTGDPAIAQYGLVTLADPEGLFLSSNLVPIAGADIAEKIAPFINPVSEAMTPDQLVAMNLQSTADQMSAADIAREWRAANGF
jgi:osmoprotectant transport system substrate-binding protein